MERRLLCYCLQYLQFYGYSEKVGFTTISYFSTAFKQYTGETPTAIGAGRKKRNRVPVYIKRIGLKTSVTEF